MKLEGLEPKAFFTHFEAISQIPRGSGNEKAVSDFVANFARKLNYKVVQDGLNNVIIYKPASPGYEKKPAVILQGHLDMVCEKNEGTHHDFMKDPLDIYIDGDFVKARGTTLGADNGTAVALCMAILEDKNLKHPALEMALTTEEETGMAGAEGLDSTLFSATRMLNLDSGAEKVVTIGCAAGVTVSYEIHGEKEAVPEGFTAYDLKIGGLRGGHSGVDIHEERGNALVIMGHVLSALASECEMRLARLQGGMKINAIPREATAVFLVPSGQKRQVTACIAACSKRYGDLFRLTEPGLFVFSGEMGVGIPTQVFSVPCAVKIVSTLLLLPNGVLAMSRDIPGLVASSCNVGVLETTKRGVTISCFPRGASRTHILETETKIQALATLTGALVKFIQRSPAWEYNPDSALLKSVVEVYEAKNGEKPVVTALHAGLECGILAEKLPGLDIVSLGPDTFDLHTPDERLSVSSVQRVWGMLLSLLEII